MVMLLVTPKLLTETSNETLPLKRGTSSST